MQPIPLLTKRQSLWALLLPRENDQDASLSVVRSLRADGHDVVAIADVLPGSDDALVMDLARILLTEDKDFGQLVYANMQPSAGVIFIRYPANNRKTLPDAVVKLIKEAQSRLEGRFIVLSPGRTRIGGNPG